MGVALIHTADWQLGKQFGNAPGDAGAALRDQRIETVKQIARLAQKRRADAIVVCGDVFERELHTRVSFARFDKLDG